MFQEMPVSAIFVLGFSIAFLKGCLCLMNRVFGLRRRDIGEIKLKGERKKKADVFEKNFEFDFDFGFSTG